MHQVQIDILQPQLLQTQIEILLDARVIRTPQFRGDEEILALDFARRQRGFDPVADLFLVLVAERGVNVSVSDGDGVGDGVFHLAWGRLPCSWTTQASVSTYVPNGRLEIHGHSGDDDEPSPRAGMSAPVLSLKRVLATAIAICNSCTDRVVGT